MRRPKLVAAAGLAMMLSMGACSPDPAPGDPVAKCMARNFPSLDPTNREQCIAACIKCENGVTTTCATECSLKARR